MSDDRTSTSAHTGHDDAPEPRQASAGEVKLREKKVTVNLTRKAALSLARVMEMKEETQTEAMNRAIQLYELVESFWADGGSILLEPGDEQSGKPIYLRMY